MGSLSPLKEERHYYLHRYISREDEGKFVFRLQEPLFLTDQQRIIIKQCVLPKIKVKFPNCKVVFNDNPGFHIPSFYISSPSEVVQKINHLLPQPIMTFYPSEKHASKAVVMLHLLPQQRMWVSSPIADLLFEGRTLLENKGKEEVTYTFSTKREYEENTYYLTCNMADKTKVGRVEISLINTLVVQHYQGENQTHLLWATEETQGKSKKGIYRSIELAICNGEGEIVQLKGGVLFIHFKVCT